MMSIVLHANSGRIEASGGFGCVGMDASKFKNMENTIFVKKDELTCPSSSSSSIGKNSDDDDEEVQSSFKGPLDMMDVLEEALPIRRGISSFYNGKSKSFTSLADASAAPSIKDITKAENVYTKKRRNLLAFDLFWDKSHRSSGGGISKRSVSLSKSALALAVAMRSSKDHDASMSLPPLHPQVRAAAPHKVAPSPRLRNTSGRRSLSVADIQYCPILANMQ